MAKRTAVSSENASYDNCFNVRCARETDDGYLSLLYTKLQLTKKTKNPMKITTSNHRKSVGGNGIAITSTKHRPGRESSRQL